MCVDYGKVCILMEGKEHLSFVSFFKFEAWCVNKERFLKGKDFSSGVGFLSLKQETQDRLEID